MVRIPAETGTAEKKNQVSYFLDSADSYLEFLYFIQRL